MDEMTDVLSENRRASFQWSQTLLLQVVAITHTHKTATHTHTHILNKHTSVSGCVCLVDVCVHSGEDLWSGGIGVWGWRL